MDEKAFSEAVWNYWFSVGEIAYMVGLSVNDACGFGEGHPYHSRFLQGWEHARLHDDRDASGPTLTPADA